MANGSQDLTRTMLAVLFIAGLIAASLQVLQPFLAATIWAATLVVVIVACVALARSGFWRAPADGQ